MKHSMLTLTVKVYDDDDDEHTVIVDFHPPEPESGINQWHVDGWYCDTLPNDWDPDSDIHVWEAFGEYWDNISDARVAAEEARAEARREDMNT